MAKPVSESRWRQQSTAVLAAIAATVLVVVLVGGMALGYAIEKNRVKSSAKTTKTTQKKSPTKVAGPAVHTKGTIDAISATGITIAPAKGAKQNVAITKATLIVQVASATAADIKAKSRVLFLGNGSYTDASAIIVLPGTAKIGDMVAAADASTMNIGTAAKSAKITITGARVEKATAATRSAIAKGAKVVVAATRKGGGLIATEILVLPNNSPFA
jgi:hypothetical protein